LRFAKVEFNTFIALKHFMETRPYADKSAKPEEASLKKVLAGSYASYKDLIHLSSDFRQQWNHSKLSGWMQKISDSKKALENISIKNL